MTPNTARALIATLLTPFILIASCGEGEPTVDITQQSETTEEPDPVEAPELDARTTTVTVGFRDSSVPPEYHRSWTLTLDAERIELSVNSYGDVIATEEAQMPAELWEEFLTDLSTRVDNLSEPATDGVSCAGGTGTSLGVYDGAEERAALVLDNCFDSHRQVAQQVHRLVEPFADLVNLSEHARN